MSAEPTGGRKRRTVSTAVTAVLWVALAAGLVYVSTRRPAAEKVARTGWTTLENCELVDHAGNDGDSFHVRRKGEEFLFRLYFVDAPETDRRFPERVVEQAAYFHVSDAECLRLGSVAEEFTAELLAEPFTVITKWVDAMGSSQMPRYYAFVTTSKGEDLANLLVDNGLVRIHGAQSRHPDGRAAREIRRTLYLSKDMAEAAGRGGWAGGK